ncbi:MAG: hypothetical protein IPN62_00310 [Flavobacteriales bacterium]|nr:hypothetical protein [Flavobacteriales bacterium]
MAAQGVTVRAGCGAGIGTVTDNLGVFLLEGVTAHEKLAHVTVENEGFFLASRSFVPTENAADEISTVNIIQQRTWLNSECSRRWYGAEGHLRPGATYTGTGNGR